LARLAVAFPFRKDVLSVGELRALGVVHGNWAVDDVVVTEAFLETCENQPTHHVIKFAGFVGCLRPPPPGFP
jgi:hypothetical protein